MRVFLGKILKSDGNKKIQKAILTGILPIAKNDILSPINNLTEYNLL